MNPDYWYAVEYDRVVKPGQVVEVGFWGESIALYRGEDGELRAMENRCAHRQLKLSLGEVTGCNLTCAYHGWSYGEGGRLVAVPHDLFGRPIPSMRIRTYPVKVRYGLIWIFPGDPARSAQRAIPDIPELEGPNRRACVPLDFTWRAHHSTVTDNICGDLTHGHLHRKYAAFADARLLTCDTQADRMLARYQLKMLGGPISGRFFDRRRVRMDTIDICFEYPYQWSDLGGQIKQWCLFLPVDRRTTRMFFLLFFGEVKIPFVPLRIPQRFLTPVIKIGNPLFVRGVLNQDGFAIEAEQDGYEAHFDAPVIELNPVVSQVRELTIRKWEEHLARRGALQTHAPSTDPGEPNERWAREARPENIGS
jgi:hypothetical protein